MANKNKDIFAPPSEQELKELDSDLMFAPPTQEELSSVPQSESSTLGDFGTGVHRGMMLGGAEELSGLGSAIGEKAADTDTFQKLADWYYAQKTNASPEALQIASEAKLAPKKSFYEAYRKGQEQEQAVSDAASQASPWAYGIGQGVGGLVPGIASAPLAIAAPATTAIGMGALTGGLESSATIEDPLDIAKDMAVGGLLGLTLQKILPGGPKKPPKPQKDILKRNEFLPQLEASKQLGEEGISLAKSQEAAALRSARRTELSSNITGKYLNPREKLKATIKEAEEALANAEKAAIKEADEAAQKVTKIIPRDVPEPGMGVMNQPEYSNNLYGLIGSKKALVPASSQKISTVPYKVDSLKNQLTKILPEITTQADQINLGEVGKTIPQLKERLKTAINELDHFDKIGPESLLLEGIDPKFRKNINFNDTRIAKKVESLIQTLRTSGKTGEQAKHELATALRELEKNPELATKFGLDPQQLAREFIRAADEASVTQKVAGESITDETLKRGGNSVRGLFAAGEATALRAANAYGQTKRTIRNFVNSSADQLASAADTLKQRGGPDLQAIAEGLSSAIPQKRNAAIFSILQLPAAKQILGIGDEE